MITKSLNKKIKLKSVESIGVEIECGIYEEALYEIENDYFNDDNFERGEDGSVDVEDPGYSEDCWISNCELRYWSENEAIKMLMLAKLVKGEQFNYNYMSDSRAIAILVSKLGPNVLNYFSGKFVIVDWMFNIKTYGRFTEDDGILLSNGISIEYFYNYNFDEEKCKFKENPSLCPTKNYHACRSIWPACPYNSWRKINENNNIKS